MRTDTITIFSMPLPFAGLDTLPQRNAIGSWMRLEPTPEIVLMGDDEGVAEAASEFGVRYIPDIERNDQSNYSVPSLLEVAQRIASHDVLMYVDCDVILTGDVVPAALKMHREFGQYFGNGFRR